MKNCPDLATIISYSSGALSKSFALLVSSHIEKCGHCKKNIDRCHEMGGSFLEETEHTDLATNSYALFLDKLEASRNKETQTSKKDIFDKSSEVPISLQRYIGRDLSTLKWSFLAPGIKKCSVKIDEKENKHLTFLKIKSKKKIPEHSHLGSELTLVLKGSFDDENGRYMAGDIADHDHTSKHEPIVTSQEDCVCVIATDGPLIFNSFIANIFQSIARI